MRVIGLDLANKSGICILDNESGKVLYSDSINLAKGDSQKRLVKLREIVNQAIKTYSPEEMAIEDVFLPAKTSPKTPIALGELRGIAKLCAAENKIPVFFYAPRQVKMAVTGYGNARKEDVVHFIQAEFNLTVKDDNEADAISVAFTHILIQRFQT